MKTFFGELRRRNVVRVGVLYAVVGWLVLQVADLAMPKFGIPQWGVTFVIFLVGLGFPLALVLAWAFELTPEGIKRTHEVEPHESVTHHTGRKLDFIIIGVLAAALLYGAFDLFVLGDRGVLAPQPRSAATGTALVSIAVLPFVDMSPAKDQEYLTDGISEELLNVLAGVEGYQVTGRTSAFAFKGRNEDLRTIGQKLGVENILEGSVRKQGERIRVTAQLVKAADGYHLWSDTYDRQLGDVFAIQDDIATQVVAAIQKALGRKASADAPALPTDRQPTDNVEAYGHYLRGQELLRTRERAGMEGALAEFEKAVALDPEFARARAAIGSALGLLAAYGYRDLAAIAPRAQAEFKRALASEPDLPEAFAGQAQLLDSESPGSPGVRPLLERAVAGRPNDSQTLVWLSTAYAAEAQATDQLRTLERAYAVDPLAPVVLINYAIVSFRHGRRELSERLMGELATLEPDSAPLFRQRSALAFEAGRLDEALRWAAIGAKRHPDDAGLHDTLAFAWSFLGDSERSRSYAAKLLELTPGNAFGVSTEILIEIQAGDLDEAAALLAPATVHYGTNYWVRSAAAHLHALRGNHAAALELILAATPRLREPSPPMGDSSIFADAPLAAYLFRETGDPAQSRRLIQAFQRGVDTYWNTVPGQESYWTLFIRARMTAVTGNCPALATILRRADEQDYILPAFLLGEPWFAGCLDDAAVAGLVAKLDARREDVRQRLRAEGL